ncbi:MAG: cellobiose phosphorylase, partial [Calditrichota bacterium]
DSVKFYLKDSVSPGRRLCTDFKELKLNLGRITGFVYGNKEHGSKWMQQNIMFMYGLYKRNFVREGYEVFKDVFQLCTNSAVARIFPGVPSYFDPEDHGAYAYLTGSSTWLMLTITTQVFGVRGEKGDLCLEPKLMKEQFGKRGQAEIFCTFRNKRIKVIYLNSNSIEWEKYQIKNLKINGVIPLYDLSLDQTKLTINNEVLHNFYKEKINIIEVSLG